MCFQKIRLIFNVLVVLEKKLLNRCHVVIEAGKSRLHSLSCFEVPMYSCQIINLRKIFPYSLSLFT
jgi:hypothetical protein